jgi:hypothetical protein
MNLRVIAKATPSSVEMSYNPELSYLYVSIDRRSGDPSPERPLRSWTPFDTTFDYDAAGRIRGIELRLSALAYRIGELHIPRRVDAYADVVVQLEYTAASETVVYDPVSRILQISFDNTESEGAAVYAISEQVLFGIRDGRLQTVWLKGLKLR